MKNEELTEFEQRRKTRILEVIRNFVNQASLKTKFDLFNKTFNVNFTRKEREILWRMRKQRNDIEHGKDIIVDDQGLENMAHIIEMNDSRCSKSSL